MVGLFSLLRDILVKDDYPNNLNGVECSALQVRKAMAWVQGFVGMAVL